MTEKKKDRGAVIWAIVVMIIIIGVIYTIVSYEPPPHKFLTPEEIRDIEQKYGPINDIPGDINDRDCVDTGDGKGCW